jgi:capsular exopolysaccharide synthesis family protein
MADQQSSATFSEFQKKDFNKPMAPREFIFRNLKYLPWILISAAFAAILAKIKIRYSVPIYHVQSSLLINNDQNGSPGGKEGERLDQLFMFQPSTNLSNEIEILKSRPLLARVARDLGLQTEYYNKGKIRSTFIYEEMPFHMVILDQPDTLNSFSFGLIIKDNDHFLLNQEKTPHVFGEPFMIGTTRVVLIRNGIIQVQRLLSPEFVVNWTPLIDYAENMSSSLKVVQVNNSATILTLSQEAPNIKSGVDVLNTIMAVYDTLIVEDKNRIAIQTLRFIDNRLDTLKNELGGTEGALRIFMEKAQLFNIDEQSKSYLETLSKNSDNKIQQEVQLEILLWLINYIGNAQNDYKAVPVNLGIIEPSLQQLIAEYNRLQLEREANLETTGPGNQVIKGLESSLEKLRTNIKEALQNVRQSYLIAGKKLAQNESEIKGNLTALPGKSMQTLNIERRQKILEDLYSFLLQKKLETTISSASTISNSKVIEPARGNTTPIRPDAKSLYLSYLLIGLLIPISIIVVIEIMSDKVTNRSEIEKATQVSILGEVGHSENKQALVVTDNSRSFISEQFRIIRTNLQYIIGKKERPTIMVTSSFSGEGKSFVSTNLGAVLALTGKKTVILEFDIRKPKILSGLDLKRNMGITNYIIGKASFKELPIAVAGVENLYVIPCGPIPPNPAEILLDPRMAELMEEVKKNFDAVIMDTAPVGLVSDAINLGQFADCTVYIVRTGYTFRRLLGFVEELYTAKKLPALTILLNDVKSEGVYGRYYGSYGYGYGYGQGSGYFEKEGPNRKGSLVNRIRHWFSR